MKNIILLIISKSGIPYSRFWYTYSKSGKIVNHIHISVFKNHYANNFFELVSPTVGIANVL